MIAVTHSAKLLLWTQKNYFTCKVWCYWKKLHRVRATGAVNRFSFSNILPLRYSFYLCHIKHIHRLHAISNLFLPALFQLFICRLSPQPHALHPRFPVSHTKIKPSQIITYEDDFIKKLKPKWPEDLRCKTKSSFKNTLTDYSYSDILTKSLLLLPVDYDENGLMFT